MNKIKRIIRKPINHIIRYGFLFIPKERLLNFYSKYSHTNKNIFYSHISDRIFYEIINKDIIKNPNNIEKYQGLLFKDDSALEWSKNKRLNINDMYDFYLKNSCITYLIEEIKNNKEDNFNILDIGCGDGNSIEIINHFCKEKSGRIDGIDNSLNAINYARDRFNKDKHSFYYSDLYTWAKKQPYYEKWKYHIGYSHLTFQLFDDKYLLKFYKLLHKKKICKILYISDTYLKNNITDKSYYYSGSSGYIRYDHNHKYLLRKVGYKNTRLLIDNRVNIIFNDATGFILWVGK